MQTFRWSRLSLQPFQRKRASREEILCLGVDISVIFVQPVLLPPRQEALVDQLAAVGDHRDVLKPQVGLVSELVLRLHLPDHDNVLNADSEGSVFVVPRLVRYHIPRCERDFRELDSGANADRALVYIEVRAYAMTCAVSVVQAILL